MCELKNLQRSMVSTKDQEIVNEFMSCLEYLKDSDPWAIEELTKMATNLDIYAVEIVEAIEQHLRGVKQEFKLPALYLIDSILKNSHRIYMDLFLNNLIELFFSAFEFADLETRRMMFRLRRTWNTILPINNLYLLDARIHSFDQGWPIKGTPSASTPVEESLNLSLKDHDQRPGNSLMQHQMAAPVFKMADELPGQVLQVSNCVDHSELFQEAILSELSFLSSPEDNSCGSTSKKKKEPGYSISFCEKEQN